MIVMHQPATTDTTADGLRRARNAMRLRLDCMTLWQQHAWLCHPGEACEDGCDAQALPERLALIESEIEER